MSVHKLGNNVAHNLAKNAKVVAISFCYYGSHPPDSVSCLEEDYVIINNN